MISIVYDYEITEGDTTWCVSFEALLVVEPPVRGSHSYHAASDVDYHGSPARLDDVESVTVDEVYDEDGEPVDLAPWEMRVLEEHIRRTAPEDVLMDGCEP